MTQQAKSIKSSTQPEGSAYVATFAERRALYTRAAAVGKVQTAIQQQPTQAETASQTVVSTPAQAGASSASTSIPPKSQPITPSAVMPVKALASACDRVQPRYADSPPLSTAATVEGSNALAKARATKGAGFQLHVHPAEVWNALSAMYAKQNGCDRVTALKDLGFVHPAISVAISRR